MRLAGEKAAQAAREWHAEDAIIVEADTLVALGEEIMGQPVSADNAPRMSRRLSGKTHRVVTGEPLDKAEAYGIQERGGRFVTRIEGCYFNVVGLPLARLWAMVQVLNNDGSF